MTEKPPTKTPLPWTESWEQANQEIDGGVNPTDYALGFMTSHNAMQKFMDKVAIMRDQQRAYYRAPWQAPEKKQLLAYSKQAEKEVDQLLSEIKNPSPQKTLDL